MGSGMKGGEFSSFEAIPDAVIMAGRDGSIVFANRHAHRLFGYEGVELLGLSIDALIPESYRRGHAQLVEGFFGEPSARPMGTNRELRGLRRDGQDFPVEIAIGTAEGCTYSLAVVRDIT